MVLGGLLLMNLALAVVYDSYMGKKAELEELERRRVRGLVITGFDPTL